MHFPTYSVGKYWMVFAPVLTLLAASGAQGADDAGTLTAARVGEPAELDGKADDQAWALARPLKLVAKRVLPPNLDSSAEVELRAVHTATHLYILARWRDATQDVSHKSWMWSSSKSAYEEGKDREDMFAVAFEHTGEFTADMLSSHDAVWDVWHWKAFRTNPQGYAMDKTHRYYALLPQGKAAEHKARNGAKVWISRPEDQGDSAERAVPAPSERQGDQVPQYVRNVPSASAADVRAKGAWADGWWTLELSRKLDTGYEDDTAVDPAKRYRMGVAAFDRTGDMDKASGLIVLDFAK